MTQLIRGQNNCPQSVRWVSIGLFVGIVLAMFCTTPASAWGKKGHWLRVQLAEMELQPEVRLTIGKLLAGKSMVSIRMWADQIRPERPETRPYHYVNFETAIDGQIGRVTVGEIINVLPKFRAILRNSSNSMRERNEALKFVIHLVGDIHQPLHCSPEGTVGGNKIKVTFFGDESNLHRVWDSGLIEAAGLTEGNYLRFLKSDTPLMELAPNYQGTCEDWAKESCRRAVDKAFNIPSDHKLGEPYFRANIKTVNFCLVLAAKRLAYILNEDLGRTDATWGH